MSDAETGPSSPPPVLAAVERAVAGLAGLADRPLSEHPEAYEHVHRILRDALSDIQA